MDSSTSVATRKELKTYLVLVLCALVILLEGFDIQAAGVSAPRIGPAFKLSPGEMGLFLSFSAFGIFLASILGGVIADRIGRKPVIVAGVAIFGLFSLSTLLATSLTSLVIARFFTGLGLGCAMPSVLAMASDHSPADMKKRAIGFIYCAIPIGGFLAGVVISSGFLGSDWQSVYIVGGIAPIVVAPLLGFLLPADKTVKAKAEKTGAPKAVAKSGLFGKGQTSTTIYLWLATFGTLFIMYLLLLWMPSLLGQMGLSKPQAQYVQMLFNLGSAIGAALGGYLLDKKHYFSTPATAYILLAVGLAVFGFTTFAFGPALLIGAVVGASVTLAQALLYAFAPLCYDASIRTTGVGATVAAGRLGTIIGPLFAGFMLGTIGLKPASVLATLIPLALLAGVMALLAARVIKRRGV